MLLDIITHPNPLLRQKTSNVKLEEIASAQIQKLIENMAETMLKKDGLGLAAPQIGKSLKIAVVNTQDGVMIFINPRIYNFSWRKETSEEGCLSVPGVFGDVKRSYKIKLRAYNAKGQKFDFTAEGLLARVLQHEVDHLNGILFIDKVKNFKKIDKL